jgi:hypothetical protein
VQTTAVLGIDFPLSKRLNLLDDRHRDRNSGRMRLQGIVLATLVLSLALIATPAEAETITLGPSLPGVFSVGEGASEDEELTLANFSLLEPDRKVSSPVNGLVTGWQVADSDASFGTGYKLQVIRPVGDGTFLVAETSTAALPKTGPASVSLSIRAGDYIGVDPLADSFIAARPTSGKLTGWVWTPALGANPLAPTNSEGEIMLDALVVPQPSVTALGQSAGPASGGTTLSIVGANLSGATAVKFGAVLAANFQIQSDGAISATSPPGPPGAVDVTVTTAAGTSPLIAGDRFTYTAGCVVPKLRGKRLKATRKALRKRACKLGKIRGERGKSARVKSQHPKAGKELPAGTKVTVKVD